MIKTCPACGGHRKMSGLAKGRRIVLVCDFCSGAGTVSEADLFAWRAGRMVRITRIRMHGLGLREAAELMGVLPSDWSEFEQGK